MPTNVPPVAPRGSAAQPPASTGTQALVRITPTPGVAPSAPTVDAPAGSPLERSGLNLLDLLDTTDVLVERADTPHVALEVGLERARGALLRNLPGDALAALDHVWEGARRTEEGWYLRSGALTVLGLPSESERVTQEGLAARPTSTALRFLQSIARAALGDLIGARGTLHQAQQRAPVDTLLRVQQAIVQARLGDGGGAQLSLDGAARAAPEHPALEYGRAGVRRAIADASRRRSRGTPHDGATVDGLARARRTPAQAAGALEVVDRERREDVTAVALFRLGARLVLLSASEAGDEARVLLRAFSAGGMLATVSGADQTQAARSVLVALVGALEGGATDTPPPLRALVQQIVPMLLDGRLDDAARLVRRSSGIGREPIGRLLQRLVDGALAAEEHATGLPMRAFAETPSLGAAAIATASFGAAGVLTPTPSRSTAIDLTTLAASGSHATIADDAEHAEPNVGSSRQTPPRVSDLMIRGEGDRSPLIPVRLGLALLEETPQSRAVARGADDPFAARRAATTDGGSVRRDSVDLSAHRASTQGTGGEVDPHSRTYAHAYADAYAHAYANVGIFADLGDAANRGSSADATRGWGAPSAPGSAQRPDREPASPLLAVAVALLLVAVAALSSGRVFAALVCGVAGLVVGVRFWGHGARLRR